MKIYLETLEKTKTDTLLLQTKTEKISVLEAESAKTLLVVTPDQIVRTHKCYHDENPAKPCEVM